MAAIKEDTLNKEQLDALSQLTDSIDKGLEIIAEKHGYNLRMTKARMEGPGFYAGQAGGKNKNKKRRMRGGAGICDGWKVSLAIDAFIIALAAGTGLGVLNFYLSSYGLDTSLGKIFNTLYDIYKSGTVMTTTGHLASAAASGTAGMFSSSVTAAVKTPGILVSLLKPISLLGLPIAGGRYLSTGISATEDLQKTLEVINRKISSMKEYSGAVTRSMRSKLESLQQKAQSLQKQINERVGSVRRTVATKHNYLKETICGVLDKIIGTVTDPFGFGDLTEESLKGLLAEEARHQGFNPSEANTEVAEAQRNIVAGVAGTAGAASDAGAAGAAGASSSEMVLRVPSASRDTSGSSKRKRGGKSKRNKLHKGKKTRKSKRKHVKKTRRSRRKHAKKTRKH